MEDCLDALAGNLWFSTMDLASGYWQISMDAKDASKTAFVTHRGLFEWRVMPFGLCNAPATFQRLMDSLLGDILFYKAVVYLDDIIAFGRTFEEALANLEAVFKRLRAAGLKLKPSKCRFFQRQVHYLGHIVGENGIQADPDKTSAVLKWPAPTNVKELRAFLGTAGYYRHFIERYSHKAAPLNDLLKVGQAFVWGSRQELAFQLLKDSLASPPVLSYPMDGCQYILDTDASSYAIGAVLSQVQDGVERPLSYASHSLTRTQRNYCTTKRELYAVVYFVVYFTHYLQGTQFRIRTDHASLRWLSNFNRADGMIARWQNKLSGYDFKIEHRMGTKHSNADGLSRIYLPCPREDCPECKLIRASTGLPGCPAPPIDEFEEFGLEEDLSILAVTRAQRLAQRKRGRPKGSKVVKGAQPTRQSVRLKEKLEELAPSLTPLEEEERWDTLEESHRELFHDDDEEAAAGPLPVLPLTPRNPNSLSEWLRMQEEDLPLMHLKRALRKGGEASKQLTTHEAEALKAYPYALIGDDGLLYYQRPGGHSPRTLIVPRVARLALVRTYHDSVSGGHFCVGRVLPAISSNFHWVGMRKDLARYMQGCETCARVKPGQRTSRVALKGEIPAERFERIAIDVLGPLEPSSRGNLYVVVIQDYFSKWVEFYPTPCHTAAVIAKCVLNWISRFGCPRRIHTDQGREFESMLVTQLCKLYAIDKTRTTPYAPWSDGMVERTNRTIKAMLRCFTTPGDGDWDDYLELLAGAYRATRHSSSGYSPNMLVLGDETLQPIDVVYGITSGQPLVEDPHIFVSELVDRLASVWAIARDNLLVAADIRQGQWGHRAVVQYKQGQRVFKWHPPAQAGKLGACWKGPLLVTRVISPHVVMVKDGRREYAISTRNLKPAMTPMVEGDLT